MMPVLRASPYREERPKQINISARFPPKLAPLFEPHRAKVLWGGRGSGKLIDLETELPTPTGWKKMGDIHIGDQVFDEAGRVCNVTEIHDDPTPTQCYRMYFSDGASIDTHADHEWVTWTHAERKSFLRSPYDDQSRFPADWPNWRRFTNVCRWGNRPKYSDTGPQIRTTDEIKDTLTYGCRDDFNHCIPVCAPLVLPSTDLPIDPYVLGYWLANGTQRDGYIVCGSYAGEMDYPHVCEMFASAGYPLHRLQSGPWSNDQLRHALRELGQCQSKFIPDAYLRGSAAQRLALMRGLMDGDGTVSIEKASVSFSNTNRQLADSMFELAVSLGQKPTLCTRRAMLYDKDCGECHTVAWRPVMQPFTLPRKADLVQPLGKQALRSQHRMITGIDPIDPKPMRCLTVDAPNHMYLVGRHMIPTHNSWGCARALLLLGKDRPLRVLCAREFQQSIADSVHRLLSDQVYELGLQDFYVIEKASIRAPNGTEFRFAGIKSNVQQIKSFEGVDICWIEEAANVSRLSWQTIIPTIRKEGSEIWITMNPELSEDESYKRWILHPPPEACVIEMNWRDNPYCPQTLLDEMELLKEENYEDYLWVYEGHTRQFLDGAVYLNELRAAQEENRITNVPYDPNTAVHAFFDLGYADATGIWFAQRCGFEHHLIEYYENSRKPLDHYLHYLNTRRFPVDFVHLPPDARAHTLGTGKSVEELVRAHGHKVSIVPALTVAEGINALRQMFPSIWADKERCADGLQALRHYRFEVMPAQRGGFQNLPVHDRFCHAADAARYLAIGLKPPKPKSKGKYDQYARATVGTSTSWMGL